jgi:hypothetical protein
VLLLLFDRQATTHCCSTLTSAAAQRCCGVQILMRCAGLSAGRHNELLRRARLACYALPHRFATRLAAHACRSGVLRMIHQLYNSMHSRFSIQNAIVMQQVPAPPITSRLSSDARIARAKQTPQQWFETTGKLAVVITGVCQSVWVMHLRYVHMYCMQCRMQHCRSAHATLIIQAVDTADVVASN